MALSEAIAAGDWRLFFLQRDRARKATLAEVQQAATTYLVQSHRIEGRYIPTEKPVRAPQTQRVDLTAVFKDYQGDPDFKAASAFDPVSYTHLDVYKRQPCHGRSGHYRPALHPQQLPGRRSHRMPMRPAGKPSTSERIATSLGWLFLVWLED